MSDEQANEVIKLRHQLRTLAVKGRSNGTQGTFFAQALERFCFLSETLGDPSLCMEALRWRVQFEQLSAFGRI